MFLYITKQTQNAPERTLRETEQEKKKMIYRKWSLLTGPAAILGGIVGTVVVAHFIFFNNVNFYINPLYCFFIFLFFWVWLLIYFLDNNFVYLIDSNLVPLLGFFMIWFWWYIIHLI